MIIIFLVLTFLRTLHGVPIPAPASFNTQTFIIRDDSIINNDDGDTRSKYDLIKSCVLTVLACVWTAAHPNIPGPRDSTWTCFKRRVLVMIYALIAPELMAMWALEQWIAAKSIADDYNYEVLGLPRKEKILLRKLLWNHSKASWGRPKERFIDCLRTFGGRQRGKTHASAGAPHPTVKDIAEIEKCSLWKRLSDSWRLFWVSASREILHELPKERARRGKGQTWTTTHGFFIQMGGFLLYEDEFPKRVLDLDSMKELIRNKQIDAPIYTEHDIQDRSKGDAISKAVVVLQTTWFVIQCITRLCAGLALSELEVATLGFALLNGIIYAVWWHKPQGVGLAIFISLKVQEEGQPKSSDELQNVHLENSQTNYEESTNTELSAGIRPRVIMDIEKAGEGSGSRENIAAEAEAPLDMHEAIPLQTSGLEHQATDNAGTVKGTTLDTLTLNTKPIQAQDVVEQATIKEGWLRRKLKEDRDLGSPWLYFSLVLVPLRFLGFLFRPLKKMDSSYDVQDGAHRVPMFHRDRRGNQTMASYTSLAIGTVFGAVHLLAWSSAFPSRTELLLWRISTLTIITVPILLMVTVILEDYKDTRLGEAFLYIVGIPAVSSIPLYIVARFTLVVLAFLSLHTLPPSAFVTISWTTFIPHL